MYQVKFYASQYQKNCIANPIRQIAELLLSNLSHILYLYACTSIINQTIRELNICISTNSVKCRPVDSWVHTFLLSPATNPVRPHVRFLRKEIWPHLHLMKHGSLLEGVVSRNLRVLFVERCLRSGEQSRKILCSTRFLSSTLNRHAIYFISPVAVLSPWIYVPLKTDKF